MQLRRRERRWLAVVIGVGVLVLGISPAATLALGAAPGSGAHCSLATLDGTYIMQAQGTQIGGPTAGPFGYASISTYDGKGGTRATYSGSFNGFILRNQPLTGTYTVNADCTSTETADLGGGVLAHYDNFLSLDGAMFTAVETDSGTVVTEVFHRVPLHSNGDH